MSEPPITPPITPPVTLDATPDQLLLAMVMDESHCGAVVLDNNGRVVYWNRWFTQASGVAVEQAVGRTLTEIFPGISGSRLQLAVEETLHNGLPAILSPRLNAHPLPLFSRLPDSEEAESMHQLVLLKALRTGGDQRCCLLQVMDISSSVAREQQLKQQARILREQSEAIQHLATHDNLTGLANRRLLVEFFVQARARSLRAHSMMGVLYLDLDHFKPINDLFGHRTGDLVLQAVGMRLRSTLRQADFVARIGGDEFVVLLEELHDTGHALATAAKLLEAVGHPFPIEGQDHKLGVSIGIALFPQHGDTLEELLHQADAAMYAVKQEGRNGVTLAPPPED